MLAIFELRCTLASSESRKSLNSNCPKNLTFLMESERCDKSMALMRARVITWSRNRRIITGGAGSLQINDRPRRGWGGSRGGYHGNGTPWFCNWFHGMVASLLARTHACTHIRSHALTYTWECASIRTCVSMWASLWHAHVDAEIRIERIFTWKFASLCLCDVRNIM